MERTSGGGGGVWTTLTESHMMRINGDKPSQDLKITDHTYHLFLSESIPPFSVIPRDEEEWGENLIIFKMTRSQEKLDKYT